MSIMELGALGEFFGVFALVATGSMSHEWVPEWAEEVERIRTQLEAAEAQQ